MKTALPALTPGQSDIQRFGLQLRLQLKISKRTPAVIQSSLDGLLRNVDSGTARFFFIHGQSHHPLHQLSDATRFTKEQRLGVLKISRGMRCREGRLGSVYNYVQLVHKLSCSSDIT